MAEKEDNRSSPGGTGVWVVVDDLNPPPITIPREGGKMGCKKGRGRACRPLESGCRSRIGDRSTLVEKARDQEGRRGVWP